MKARLVFGIASATLALLATSANGANTATWVPGTPYYASEEAVADLFKTRFDFAFCSGIQRFGRHGSFPYETYRVFDCDTKLNRTFCTGIRVRAVKASRRGYFQLKKVRMGKCI